MNRQLDESSRQDGGEPYPLEYLAEVSGLSIEEIEDLVAIGVITPSATPAQPRIFRLCHVLTVKKARRLRDDFQLDYHGVALALTLLRHIDELRAEVRVLRGGRDR
jgi:chaperone modulatory protein CbpM